LFGIDRILNRCALAAVSHPVGGAEWAGSPAKMEKRVRAIFRHRPAMPEGKNKKATHQSGA
jgi:hypothetical protein